MAQYQLDTTFAKETAATLDAFTRGYVEAAMWTLTDEDGESCDHMGLHDIHASALDRMREDCADFQTSNAAILAGADEAQAGHDFWLTRNGHGAGFWDRSADAYPNDPAGLKLSDAARAYGSADLYIGDDGMIYHY